MAMTKTKRRKSAVVDNSQPGWKLMRDFYLKRFAAQLEEKK